MLRNLFIILKTDKKKDQVSFCLSRANDLKVTEQLKNVLNKVTAVPTRRRDGRSPRSHYLASPNEITALDRDHRLSLRPREGRQVARHPADGMRLLTPELIGQS